MIKGFNKGMFKLITISIILVIAIVFGIMYYYSNLQSGYCDKDNECVNTCCGCININDKCDIECEALPERECECVDGKCDIKVKKEDSEEEEIELGIDILKEGEGIGARNGNNVSVHYVGTLEDGTKFDSSIDRGKPFVFTLGAGKVISGWEIGVLGMKIGEKRKLTIPPELGYGKTGVPGAIPPDSVLIFEIELLDIN